MKRTGPRCSRSACCRTWVDDFDIVSLNFKFPAKAIDDIGEAANLDDAEVVVVSYGITSRVAQRAIEMARAEGLKVGKLRLITAWPFPAAPLVALTPNASAFVVPELNLGQMVHEVQRAVCTAQPPLFRSQLGCGADPWADPLVCAGPPGPAPAARRVIPVTHAGGSVHQPEQILQAILEATR